MRTFDLVLDNGTSKSFNAANLTEAKKAAAELMADYIGKGFIYEGYTCISELISPLKKIANNTLSLRIATTYEREIAKSMITPTNERQNTRGYSFYMNYPKYVLVSDVASPEAISFFAAVENNNGELESCGWIGKA